jgi:hypothetical protein
MESTAFTRFRKAQIHVNEFLWSSELSLALVQQKLVGVEYAKERVATLFLDLQPVPNCFIANNKAGTPKYNPTISHFRTHLEEDLESLCRYVIVRFHSALELFIWMRLEPLLGLEGVAPRQLKNIRKSWQERDYRSFQKELGRLFTLRSEIPKETADLAQAFRMLRNSIVHLQHTTFFDVAWSDSDFRKKIDHAFTGARKIAMLQGLCDRVANLSNPKNVPPLFFYALFILTNYRNFAKAVEESLPEAA